MIKSPSRNRLRSQGKQSERKSQKRSRLNSQRSKKSQKSSQTKNLDRAKRAASQLNSPSPNPKKQSQHLVRSDSAKRKNQSKTHRRKSNHDEVRETP
jgi:hypothetical protein